MGIKQLKKLISIKNMLETATYLSEEYITYEEKSFSKDNIVKRGIIYKLFCSNMFNLIEAINKATYLFEGLQDDYILFENEISKKYISTNSKYYEKVGKSMTFYEVLREMRHEVNHFEKDVNDQITMFEIEIRFEEVEGIRKIIAKLVDKKYKEADPNEIKNIILLRPKVLYEKDRIDNAIINFEEKIEKVEMSDNYKQEMVIMINILKDIFSPDMLIDLFNEKRESIEMFNSKLEEIEKYLKQYDIDILKSGTKDDIEKYNKMKSMVEEFQIKNESVGFNKYKENMEKLKNEVVLIYTENSSESKKNEE